VVFMAAVVAPAVGVRRRRNHDTASVVESCLAGAAAAPVAVIELRNNPECSAFTTTDLVMRLQRKHKPLLLWLWLFFA